MSEHKKENLSSVQSHMPKSHIKYMRLAIVGITLIIIVIAIYFISLSFRHKKMSSTPLPKVTSNLQEQAFGFSLIGHSAEAQNILDKAIQESNDPKTKSQYYVSKSSIAYGDQEYSNSLIFAKRAEALYPDADTATCIARSSLALGDKTTALHYYQLVIARFGKVHNPSELSDIKAQIAQLEG